jgi:hypothetical protein
MVIMSIIILTIETIFIIVIQRYNKIGKTNIFIKIVLWIIFFVLLLNIIGNALGKTLFERILMEIICIIQIVNILRIIIENNKLK